MCFTETAERATDAFNFDLDSGTISNRRRIVKYDEGYPDCMTIDTEGKL